MRISKFKLLGVFNALLGIFFFTMLIAVIGGDVQYFKPEYIFKLESLPGVILLLSICMNATLVYYLFFRKEKDINYHLFTIITFSTVVWFFFMFFGYFFVSDFAYLVITPVAAFGLFVLIKNHSRKIAFFISGTTVLVFLFTLLAGFEENYCWKRGDEIAKNRPVLVQATKEDAERLKGPFAITEGATIGAAFRAHMYCHQSFNLWSAMKEKYLFLKE